MAKAAKKYDYITAIENITNNPPFLNTCFDSVRAGNPIMIDISTDPDSSISCLEYILDAVIVSNEKPTRVDLEIFEQLATIDLNAELCHEIGVLNNPSAVSCLPHVMNAYVSATKKGVMNFSDGRGSKLVDQNSALNRVSAAMRSVVSKYPDLMAQRICRPSPGSKVYGNRRDHYTCIDKIMSMGYNVDFIKVEDFPDGYFNAPLCMGIEGESHTCYDKMINGATSIGGEYSAVNMGNNYARLLESMIRSKKYGRELYTDSGMCSTRHQSLPSASCLEKLIHSNPILRSTILHRLLLNVYSTGYDIGMSHDVIIDEVSEYSPFSGKKCISSSGIDTFTSCIDELLQTSITIMQTYVVDHATRTNALDNVKYIFKHRPKTGDPCKQLELVKLFTPQSGAGGTWVDVSTRELVGSILDSALPRKDSTLNELSAITCLSNIGGRDHNVNGIDYALELGSPMTYLMYEYGTDDTHIDYVLKRLSEPICTSIETGSIITCFEKLATELFFEPMLIEPGGGSGSKLRETSRYIADVILERSDENPEMRMLVYPKGKSYFTDYLTDSIYDAIKTNSATARDARDFLDNMIVFMDASGVQFTDDTYPRLSKILDIIDYGVKDSKDLSETRQSLYDKFEWNEENIRKAIHSYGFVYYSTSAADPSNILDILSKWYDKYKGTPLGEEIKDIVSRGVRDTVAGDGVLPEFYRIYTKSEAGRIPIAPEINQLFEVVYGKTMTERFKPSPETRMEYDQQCFGAHPYPKFTNRQSRKGAPGLDFVYNDVPGNSNLKPDDLDIVGVYDVTEGATGLWGSEHIWRYANAMSKIMWGSTDVIGKPYVHVREESKWQPVPVGLFEAINTITAESPPELIGERKRNLRGRLRMDISPALGEFTYRKDTNYTKNIINNNIDILKRNGGDFRISLFYVDEKGNTIPERAISFKLLDAMDKLPTKLKTKIQQKYPVMFGQLASVIKTEKALPEDTTGMKNYKMTISNKPVDVVRCSACQVWDNESCISIFGGFHNNCLQCYLRGDSYIAYLTTTSEYEPRWRSRLLMHKCKNGKSVSIQNQVKRYDMTVDSGSEAFPNWHLLYDAVQVTLADREINSSFKKYAQCDHTWIKGTPEKVKGAGNIDDEGLRICKDKEGRILDSCTEVCYDSCHSVNNYDPGGNLEDDVLHAIDRLIEKELEHYKSTGGKSGKYTISKERIESIKNETRTDNIDEIRKEIIDRYVEDCQDGCRDSCREWVLDDFDCRSYLTAQGYFDGVSGYSGMEDALCADSDGGGYADYHMIDPLVKGNAEYKDILLERTGQTKDSSLFVKRIKTEF